MKQIAITVLVLNTLLFSQTLTLNESIEKTLLHHPNIKTVHLQVEQSKSSYDAAFADYLPQVTLQANYNALQTFVFPANGTFNTVEDSGWNAGAFAQQKIWDFTKTSAKVDAIKLDEGISSLTLEDAKALLVYKVKLLYELMVVQKEAIGVREQDMQVKEAYYKQSIALVKQGLKTDIDASRFESAFYYAKESVADSKASYQKAKNSLSLYMGEAIADGVELESSSLESSLHVDTLVEQNILEKNYQLKISSQTIEKNKLLYKSTHASHYGSVDAVASYNHINTLNIYDSKLVGVTLTVPLYSGGRISAQSQQAEIATQIANAQKASKKLLIQEETKNLLADIKRFHLSIAAKKAQLQSSNKTKKLLDGRYQEGLATYIEVLDATALALDAKLGLLSAKYQLSSAIHRLEYLQGDTQ